MRAQFRAIAFFVTTLLFKEYKYTFELWVHLFIHHGYITNSQYGQLPAGLIVQLVEHYTGIAEVMGLNPVQA